MVTPNPQPLTGVRVIELAVAVAGPATGAMLADWGASVVKVEPPNGEAARGNTQTSYFELDNRNKLSICVDLKTEEGLGILLRLLETADVFLTNLRPAALGSLGLDYETLAQRFPRLVYASITGYGPATADKAGYDIGAFWSRAGIAMALTPKGEAPPVSRPGLGDHSTGLAMVGGIAGALFQAERTGRGTLVQTSLLRTGLYVLGSDLMAELAGAKPGGGLRRALYNPLLGCYRAQDDRWFWLLGLQTDRHWPGLIRALERPELATDERFASHEGLIIHRDALIALLDDAFAQQPMAHWSEVFAREDVWWDPVQDFEGVVNDPIVAASGAFPAADGPSGRTVASPVDFAGQLPSRAGRAPEAGENTEELLLAIGYEWADIERLQRARVVP
jgi:crotonobetainyl-CoA:carnitine CoA-transferase CaiB-like acyl-CoA transferase